MNSDTEKRQLGIDALAALEAEPKDGVMIMIDLEQFKIIQSALNALINTTNHI
jgi:hypothetical protein